MKFVTRLFRDGRAGCAALATSLAFLGTTAGTAEASAPVGVLATGVTTQAGFGSIKGRLVWGGDQAPDRKILAAKGQAPKDPGVCAAAMAIPADDLVVDPQSKGVQYGFAYLLQPKGENPEALKQIVAKAAEVEVDQKNCRFVPHALAMVQNQKAVFKSSDPVAHNIRFAAFQNAPFNQILPPNGSLTMNLIPERRPIPLACDIHPWMKGYMMVFDHPFFAVTGEDGSFEIQGIPAGAQNLVVWQETIGYVTQGAARGTPVEVKAGETVNVGDIRMDPAKVKQQ